MFGMRHHEPKPKRWLGMLALTLAFAQGLVVANVLRRKRA